MSCFSPKILFAFLLSFAVCKAYTQPDLNLIKEIKRNVTLINNHKHYTIVSFDDAEEFLGQGTDNGASLIGYFDADSLKKITEWVGLSDKIIQREIYLSRNNVIFVYVLEKRYMFDKTPENLKLSSVKSFEGRYYFKANQLIKKIIANKVGNDKLSYIEEIVSDTDRYMNY